MPGWVLTAGHCSSVTGAGYDISLLKVSQNTTMATTEVAGAGERSLWTAGALETIVGWG